MSSTHLLWMQHGNSLPMENIPYRSAAGYSLDQIVVGWEGLIISDSFELSDFC